MSDAVLHILPEAGPFTLNDKAEFYWEFAKDGVVLETLEKTADDSNRVEALAQVARLNRDYKAEVERLKDVVENWLRGDRLIVYAELVRLKRSSLLYFLAEVNKREPLSTESLSTIAGYMETFE